MTNSFFLYFENGMPRGTSQEKGECIRYRIDNGKRVPYIHHFKKNQISATRQEYELKLKRHRPRTPSEAPIRLTARFYFDVKERKLWGKPKTTRADCSNIVKELEDAMTAVGFWRDDSQIVELKVSKSYAEKATIFIQWEELEP